MDKKNVAVIGASPKEDRYSHKALKLLRQHGYHAIPVAPVYTEILGQRVFATLDDVSVPVDTVTLYLAPHRQAEVIERILSKRPRRVIFNPGTENPAVYAQLEAAGIQIEEACTLVLLGSGQF